MRLIDMDEIRIKPEYMHDICGVAMIRVEDIARILNDMPTINPEPHWIPVTERLPEIGMDILICDIEGDIYLTHMTRHESFYNDLGDRVKNIRAWMPLPEPYQPKENES